MIRFKIKKHILNDQGFTLIEVLIAIVILSFISLFTYKMVDSSSDTKDRVTKEDRELLQTLTALNRLDADFLQVYSPLYSFGKTAPLTSQNDSSSPYQDTYVNKNADGKTRNGLMIPQFFSEDKSSIIMFTQANRRKISNTKESRYAWIKYSLRRSEISTESSDEEKPKAVGDSELIRQVISTNIYTNDLNWSEVKAQILMTGIKSLEFSFWDERAKKYTNSIQDLNENKNQLRSIKINFTWINKDGNEQKIERTFRILNPYFNPKVDDLKLGNSGTQFPPGVPDPTNPTPAGGGIVQ